MFAFAARSPRWAERPLNRKHQNTHTRSMPPIIDDRDEHLPKLDMAAAVSAAEGSGGSQTAVLRSAPPSVSFATHGESTSQAASPFRFETAAAKAQEQQQHHHHHHHHHHSGEHHGGGTKNQPPATTVGGETRSAPSSFGTAERAKVLFFFCFTKI